MLYEVITNYIRHTEKFSLMEEKILIIETKSKKFFKTMVFRITSYNVCYTKLLRSKRDSQLRAAALPPTTRWFQAAATPRLRAAETPAFS